MSASNTNTNTSFGIKVGRALGNGAAYAVHGVAMAAQASGQFGRDVVAGATDQYAVKAAELHAARVAAVLAHRAAREQALAGAAEVEVVAAAPAKRQRKLAVGA